MRSGRSIAEIIASVEAREFRRLAWRWLRPPPKLYAEARVFVNGVELVEVADVRVAP